MNRQIEKRLESFIPEWTSLIAALIPEIQDDYRATDDPDDNEPGMQVTIATDEKASEWGYQTGDNSYTGGAYSFPHWAVLYLSRDSDPKDIANEAADQIAELMWH